MATSILATQDKLNDLSTKFEGRTPIRIHFLDNGSKVFLVDDQTSVKDVLIMILEKFGVSTVKDCFTYFGLFEARNGGTIDGGALAMETSVTSVTHNWTAVSCEKTAKFLFMVRLHMPCVSGLQHKDVVAFRMGKSAASSIDDHVHLEAAELTDSACLHLQFMQAVYNVITGRYPTSKEDALTLGAIHFLFKFGAFSPTSHQPGFLGNRIVELIPIKHLKSGSEASIEEWEKLLLARVISYSASLPELAATTTEDDATPISSSSYSRNGHIITPERQYMEIVYKMPCFGMALYKCSQRSTRKLPETLFVGLHRQGITLLDKRKTCLKAFNIEEIFRWGFKPKQLFYFEVDADNDLLTGSLDFETEDGNVMSDLLTDYAMAFLKEREAEQKRMQQMKAGNLEGVKIGEERDKIISTSQESQAEDSNEVTLITGTGVNADDLQISLGGDIDEDVSNPTISSPSNKSVGQKFKRLSIKNKVDHNSGKLSASSATPEEHNSATKVQSVYRGWSLRHEWSREEAAITVQTQYRGYRARVLIGKMIEAMFDSGALQINE